jgi:4-hydroxy-tetrahydrodipicolinate synthase
MLWTGVYGVLVTPQNSDGTIDHAGLAANVEFLAGSECGALISLGSEGKFYALTDTECRVVVETTVSALRGRKPLVVGVAHPSKREAVALSQHVEAVGVDATMATPPYYVKTDEAGLYDYFRTLAEATRIPLSVYNSPGRVALKLSPTFLARAMRELDLGGVKQAGGEIAELAELLHTNLGDRQVVVGGAEATIWPALAIGAEANTATAATALPVVFAALFKHARHGELAAGANLYRRLGRLRAAYRLAGGQAAVVKHPCERRGLAASGAPPRADRPRGGTAPGGLRVRRPEGVHAVRHAPDVEQHRGRAPAEGAGRATTERASPACRARGH